MGGYLQGYSAAHSDWSKGNRASYGMEYKMKLVSLEPCSWTIGFLSKSYIGRISLTASNLGRNLIGMLRIIRK